MTYIAEANALSLISCIHWPPGPRTPVRQDCIDDAVRVGAWCWIVLVNAQCRIISVKG